MKRIILAARPGESALAERLARRYRERGVSYQIFRQSYGRSVPDRQLLHTAMSGGSLRERLAEAVGRFGGDGVAVWLDRSAEDFLLPSPTGAGRALTREELSALRERRGGSVFFSPELCAHYFTYMEGSVGHFVLFDDAGSLRKKLQVAGEAGITTAYLPLADTQDMLGEILQ